jgi:hypothetical protein
MPAEKIGYLLYHPVESDIDGCYIETHELGKYILVFFQRGSNQKTVDEGVKICNRYV